MPRTILWLGYVAGAINVARCLTVGPDTAAGAILGVIGLATWSLAFNLRKDEQRSLNADSVVASKQRTRP